MGETARIYRCGECGGPNSEADRHCSYCQTPIATLRCAHCYHLNVPDNRNCSACGEVLGLVPASVPTSVDCAECAVPFEALEGDPGTLFDCKECGGQFVEHRLLHDLLERRRRFAKPGPIPKANPLHHDVVYVRCPICRELMMRRNFGGSSGIIVDCCAAHGIWFDHGELTRVLAYVEAGGLADARRHRLGLPSPMSDAQRQSVARAVGNAMQRKTSTPPQSGDASSTAAGVAFGIAESTFDLLALLGDFVTGSRL